MKHIVLRLTLLALLTAGALAATPAMAQSASEVAAARSLFEEGVAAAGDARWQDALSAFERSYAIAPRSTTLLNLAGAQVQLGRLVAASESYQRLIREAGSNARERRLRDQAREALTGLEPRIAHLTLNIADLARTDEVLLDETAVSHAIVGVSTPVDPGDHRVSVRRDDREIGQAAVTLSEGGSREVTVLLHPGDSVAVVSPGPEEESPSVPAAALTGDPQDGGGGEDLAASPILWTIVGVVVVGGVVAAVVATQVSSEPSYYTGNLGEGQIRF